MAVLQAAASRAKQGIQSKTRQWRAPTHATHRTRAMFTIGAARAGFSHSAGITRRTSTIHICLCVIVHCVVARRLYDRQRSQDARPCHQQRHRKEQGALHFQGLPAEQPGSLLPALQIALQFEHRRSAEASINQCTEFAPHPSAEINMRGAPIAINVCC